MRRILSLFAVIIGSSLVLGGCATKNAVTPAVQTASVSDPSTAATAGRAAGSGAVESEAIQTEPVPAAPAIRTDAPSAGEDRTTLRLETVYFGFDSHLLTAEARETLSRNARALDAGRSAQVELEGHADERGSDEYNLALGEKRAGAARRYLESLGISAERLSTVSYGEERPAVDGHGEETWAQNRRVEFVIVR
jgi:peptidoglycan-associated lipoprotein